MNIGHKLNGLPTKQHGAALVVGLLLLLVITMLAISGINSASVEFVMAGNDQYHQNAFQAAEAGIADVLSTAAFNPGAGAQTTAGVALSDSKTETYDTTVTPALSGAPQPALWGNKWDSFSTFHFQIDSTGHSARNALASTVQGVAVLSPWDSSVLPDTALATTKLQ
jgi:Tfp pilus assembly protein PilX